MAERVAENTLRELLAAIQELSLATRIEDVERLVPRAARRLTGADGATFVLSDGRSCLYAGEDAIAPLWKGSAFPMEQCVSGWSIANARPAVIEDIYDDPRVPVEAYRPTFVKSLLMTPIRAGEPLGAIGLYWAEQHEATEEERGVAQALADSTAVALEHIRVVDELERTVRLAETDPLTGITNRRGWDVALGQALRADAGPTCIGLIDLDRFKDYNDRHGHVAGDQYLRDAARAWRRALRTDDILARYGGEEFALLLPDCELDRAHEVAERVRRASPAGETVSIGVACWDRIEDAQALVTRADAALYRAKEAGRDRVVLAG